VFVLVFLVVNRGAYRGYFAADDFDTLSWTSLVPPTEFVRSILTPRTSPHNFRPVGHYYYHVLLPAAGLNFWWYVAVLQGIHLLNAALIWFILRRIQISPFAAGAGAVFFAFHMAVMEAFWKPMYIFDVSCTMFVLLSLLAYAYRRFVISFVAFWLAYKCKEIAIALPVMFAMYEFWLGDKRWLRLLPFFAVSLSFGLQGVILTRGRDDDYTLRFTLKALAATVPFYSSRAFWFPFSGIAMLALFICVRDRRVWFGVAGFWVMLGVMLFLPTRIVAAYLYAPLAMLSVSVAALAHARSKALVAVLFLPWLAYNFHQMREGRRTVLAEAHENQWYVHALAGAIADTKLPEVVIYDGSPALLPHWGIQGAVRLISHDYKTRVMSIDDPLLRKATKDATVGVFSWDGLRRQMHKVERTTQDEHTSYVSMSGATPVWLLDEGWSARHNFYRWIEPVATARLYRRAGATRFELSANVPPDQIEALGRVNVELFLNGVTQGIRTYEKNGLLTIAWNLAPAAEGNVEVELRVTPPFGAPNDPRTLGVAVMGFGFRVD
jgi:hypothetical protein